jgi:hypothetical protein
MLCGCNQYKESPTAPSTPIAPMAPRAKCSIRSRHSVRSVIPSNRSFGLAPSASVPSVPSCTAVRPLRQLHQRRPIRTLPRLLYRSPLASFQLLPRLLYRPPPLTVCQVQATRRKRSSHVYRRRTSKGPPPTKAPQFVLTPVPKAPMLKCQLTSRTRQCSEHVFLAVAARIAVLLRYYFCQPQCSHRTRGERAALDQSPSDCRLQCCFAVHNVTGWSFKL